MNKQLIARYLQLLRKQKQLTQDELAKKICVSRQAVSKWENGNTLPDIDILLKLSKLYNITINEILEPVVKEAHISCFEQITEINEKKLCDILSVIPIADLVKASMGSSPEINDYLQKLLPDIDFAGEQMQTGRIKIEEIEDVHSQIVNLINIS